ncbi:hypothetical protein E4T43_07099 [Aureobasidium subglaciale]|nr:hypothetical protein E4T43_07099 [Aureobasidium subglaciale]
MYGGKPTPPFRATIPEYPWMQTYKNRTTLNAQYFDILSATNCSTLACLRALSGPASKDAIGSSYESGYTKDLYAYDDFYYGPSVDGHVIQALPPKELEAGYFVKVPMLTHYTSFEGAGFSNFSTKTLEDTNSKLHTLWPSAGPAFYRRFDQLYPISSFTGDSRIPTSIQLLSQSSHPIYGDFIINCPTYNLATAFSNAGLPVYKMLFRDGTQIHGASATYLG